MAAARTNGTYPMRSPWGIEQHFLDVQKPSTSAGTPSGRILQNLVVASTHIEQTHDGGT
jgi:hypothetical protein